MKKNILVALVVAFMTLMASLSCFADVTGVADTSKEGSLLIWPLIDTTGDNETYIIITNSTGGGNETQDLLVNIKCFWEVRDYPWQPGSGEYCPLSDAIFYLSRNNPLIFRASDGNSLDGIGLVPPIGKDMKGMLKCWAVSPNDTNQIAWNHLSGYGIVLRPGDAEPKKSALKYSAWRFAANVVKDDNGTEFAEGFWVGKTIDGGDGYNTMKLWGASDVVTRLGTATPYCSAGVTVDCCRPTTTAIKMRQTFPDPPSVAETFYTYYCIQKVNSDKCPRPYEAAGCDKPLGVYDACPSYLTFDFLAEPSTPTGTDGHAFNILALAPCREDLRSEGEGSGQLSSPTKLVFSVWNANEVKYTGTYACANCNGPTGYDPNTRRYTSTYDLALQDLRKGSLNYFQQQWLHTDSGRFRVEGLASGGCPGAVKTPLVGVMATRLLSPINSIDYVATGGTASGPLMNKTFINGQGNVANTNPAFIKWDITGVPWKSKR